MSPPVTAITAWDRVKRNGLGFVALRSPQLERQHTIPAFRLDLIGVDLERDGMLAL